jgi:hypothetical protein
MAKVGWKWDCSSAVGGIDEGSKEMHTMQSLFSQSTFKGSAKQAAEVYLLSILTTTIFRTHRH